MALPAGLEKAEHRLDGFAASQGAPTGLVKPSPAQLSCVAKSLLLSLYFLTL